MRRPTWPTGPSSAPGSPARPACLGPWAPPTPDPPGPATIGAIDVFLVEMRLTRASALAVLLAVLAPACLGAAPATARKTPGLTTGVDDFAFQTPATAPLALERAKSARASIVRIVLTWASAEPTAP